VAVVSVCSDPNIVPEILYTNRKEIKYYGGLNSRRFLFSMINAFEEALTDLQKNFISISKNIINIKETHCFFSSLWHISQTRVLTNENGKDTKIIKSLINRIVEKESKIFETSTLKGDIDISAEDIQIIEKKIMQIKLNGYETSEPYSKMAKTLEINFFISAVSKKVIKILEESFFRFFNNKIIQYHTFINTAFVTLRDINPTINDYLFLDISGEITEIAIIKNGVLFDSISFPFGKNSIVRKLSEALGTNKEEAISRASLYKSNDSIKIANSKISKIIENLMKEWHKLFDISIKQLLSNIALPQGVFFMSDDDVSQLVGDFIKLYKFDNIDTFEKLVNVKFIDNEIFEEYVKYNNQGEKDQFLSLETIFLKKMKKL
ncbi:MAG: cell division protein FtsA, partial [Patescibacteria group bacterium]